jgi:hypothetical protein
MSFPETPGNVRRITHNRFSFQFLFCEYRKSQVGYLLRNVERLYKNSNKRIGTKYMINDHHVLQAPLRIIVFGLEALQTAFNSQIFSSTERREPINH